jgi:hypothetical protein
MKYLDQLFSISVAAVALCLGSVNAFSQDRPNWSNMDPQQIQQMIQQRIMENFREQMGVTNDNEWKLIEERLSKVSRLRMETMLGGGGLGMFGGMRGPGGGGGGGGAMRGLGGLSRPDPNAEY